MDGATWSVARAGGIVAWLLLVASTACGVMLATRRTAPRLDAAWVLGLHRYLGGLAVAFTGVHVVAIVADDFVSFGWADVLVPMAASWHPLAVTWGVVGMYLLVAVEISSIFRPHLSPRAWRAIHLLSYALFGVTSVHALTAGTEARDFLSESAVIVLGAAVVFVAVLLLVFRSAPRHRASRAEMPGH
jgi:DMSO/TMAO reductase YedYZ heme-binding membrane subunit